MCVEVVAQPGELVAEQIQVSLICHIRNTDRSLDIVNLYRSHLGFRSYGAGLRLPADAVNLS